MTITPFEWRAHVTDDFMQYGRRVHLARPAGPGMVDVVTGFREDGTPTIDRFSNDVNVDAPGFLLPQDALEALVEKVKPGPASGELGALREALKVERDRIDRLLDRLAP